MMSFENSKIEPPINKRNPHTARFIQNIREGENYNNILQDVFKRSSTENPYETKINHCINLSRGLSDEKRQQYLDEKRRQQLRENNQELKTLESHLRSAYVRKTICAQIFERQAAADNVKFENRQRIKAFADSKLSCEEFRKKTNEEERLKKEAHKQDLIEQMAEMNLKRMQEYKDIQDEGQRMEKMVQQYKKDQERKLREAAEEKRRTKAEMEEYIRSKEELKLAHSQANEEANERLLEFVRQRERDQERAKQEKKAQQQRKDQWVEEMGRKIQAAAMEKTKIRDTIAELLIDERNANEEIAERKELELRMHQRNELRLQMERDFEDKQRRKEAEKKNDEEMFQMEMRMLAERDKLEQLSNEKRHRKSMEHRRAFFESFDEKKRRKIKETIQELHERDLELEAEEKEKNEIEAERIRMLKEYAEVLDFVPPGIVNELDKKLVKKN